MNLHFVYVARSADGQPLYVGRTSNIHLRIKAHHSQATWWADDVTFEVIPVYEIADAARREMATIAALRPPHNRIGNPDFVLPNRPWERGTLLAAVLNALEEAGEPLSTTEIRKRIEYRNTGALLQRLHRTRKVKPVAFTPAGNWIGSLAWWALEDWPQPEAQRPLKQQVAS